MKKSTRISTLVVAGIAALSLSAAPLALAAPADAPANQPVAAKRGTGLKDGSGPKRLHLRDGSCDGSGVCDGTGAGNGQAAGPQDGTGVGPAPQDGTGYGNRGQNGGVGGQQTGPQDGTGPRAGTGDCPNA